MYSIADISYIMCVKLDAVIAAKSWAGVRCDTNGLYSPLDVKLIVEQIGKLS